MIKIHDDCSVTNGHDTNIGKIVANGLNQDNKGYYVFYKIEISNELFNQLANMPPPTTKEISLVRNIKI